jgi:crotonobetainyl-CoA:carnitine CoA-transferase CaiB-like acyl-CoA transferase
MIRFGGSVTVERCWEQAAAFTGVNLGKRAVTADFGTEEGQRIIRQLIASSDVVLENFVPRVLDSHALGYDQLRAIKPDIVMVRMPAWGLTGPWRDRPGFTYTVNAVCGLSHLTGYPDGEPLLTGTIVDPMAAAYATLITLAAIRRLQHTGQGGHIEVPLCDVAAQLTARAAIAAATTGTEPARTGNHSDRAAPQGIYQCADGTWIAVTVSTDYQWKALTELSGLPAAEQFVTLDGRLARERELDEWVAALCSMWEAPALRARLRQAGIPAAIAATGSDLTEHPQLIARGRVFTLTHPVFGVARYIGPPARYAAAPLATMPAPSPLFGQHNHEILTELGYTPADIERLTETNAIGDTPFGRRAQPR